MLNLILYILAACSPYTDDDQKTGRKNAVQAEPPSIEVLIAQLGASEFNKRQNASEQLWIRGREAEAQLRRAANNSGDREIRKRAGAIVEMFDLGVYHDTPRRQAEQVIRFHKGSHQQREAIVKKLSDGGRWELAIKLIETLKDPTARFDIIRDGLSHPNEIVSRLVVEQKWNDIESIFSQPLMAEHYPDQCAWIATVAGHHEKLIKDYEEIVQGNSAAWQRSFLIQLYSGSGQIDKALELAQKSLKRTDDPKEFVIAHTFFYLCAQHQRWQSASNHIDQYVVDTKHSEAIRSIWSPQTRRLYYHQMAGKKTAYEKSLEQFLQNDGVLWEAPDALRIVMAVMEHRHVPKLRADALPSDKFETLCQLDQISKAFETIELPASSAKRNAWFQERRKAIKALWKKSNGILPRSRSARDYQKLLPAVALQLGILGNEQEAMKYLSQMMSDARAADQASLEFRSRLLRIATRLDENRELWLLITEQFHDQEYPLIYDVLFDDLELEASNWDALLKRKFKHPLDRIRNIAAILNVKWKDPEHSISLEDMVLEAENTLAEGGSNAKGIRCLAIAKAFQRHQQLDGYFKWLQVASDAGNEAATMTLAKEHWKKKEWDQAHKVLGRLLDRNPRACVARYMQGLIEDRHEKKLGRTLSSPLNLLELGLINSRDLQLLINHLQEVGEIDTLFEVSSRWLNCSRPIYSTQNAWVQYRLANALADHEHPNASQPWSVFVQSQMDRQSSMVNSLNMAAFARRARTCHLKQLIVEKRFERFKEIAKQLREFQPIHSDLGDEIVPLLDQVGQKQLGDSIIEQTVAHFHLQIERFPESALYHNNLAWICAKSKRKLDLAKTHAQKACALRKGNPTYLDTLAEVHFQRGEIDEAIRIIRRCINTDPTYRHYQDQLEKFRSEQAKNGN